MQGIKYIFRDNSLINWGIYLSRRVRDIYWDIRSMRFVAKLLKGGYYVIKDGKKHELARGPLKVGWFRVTPPDDADIKQTGLASSIEFFTKDRELVSRTKI